MSDPSLLALATTGLTLGLAGGLAPGPLTTLVLTTTLQHGMREGVKVALVPILTDGPLMWLSTLAVAHLTAMPLAMGLISLCGGLFLLSLAWHTAHIQEVEVDPDAPVTGTWAKAVTTNLLNPHPYVFWVTVGGPLLAQATEGGTAHVVAFASAFFLALCGTKVIMAALIDRARAHIAGPVYRWVMRGLALALAYFAVRFLLESGRQFLAMG